VTVSSVPSGPASGVPTEAASVGPVASPKIYTVKSGDTLARIAKKFKVTVQDILDANPDIENPDDIKVGDKIVIPPASS
jgi:morphogenetic protein associated with SpoVID